MIAAAYNIGSRNIKTPYGNFAIPQRKVRFIDSFNFMKTSVKKLGLIIGETKLK